MTAVSPLADRSASDLAPAPRRGMRWDARIERLSEWMNPILIKEARQALKSRQFVISFGLLLFAAWVWSVAGVLLMMPGLYYNAGGAPMLMGYYFVLAVPMLAVVPLAANRSLAAEMDEATFELLSITALSPLQIVLGKLASALLQMLVYFAALVPCLAFTYLLRGVDIPTILLVVGLTFFVALMLTVAGLLLATLSSGRSAQMFLMILLLALVVVAEIAAGTLAVSMIDFGMPVNEAGFAEGLLGFVTIAGSFCVIGVLAAAARLTPVSENRSTRLRIMMLVQQVLWVGWLLYAAIRAREDEMLAILLIGITAYWLVMGTLMLGESSLLSPRIRRGLPQSFLARTFLTWFNPGPGTGLVFATVGAVAAAATVVIFGEAIELPRRRIDVPGLALLLVGYLMLFLGITRLGMLLLRRMRVRSGLLAATAVQGVVMSLSAIVPYGAVAYANDYRSFGYSLYQLTNWAWTFAEHMDGTLAPDVCLLVFLVGLFGIHLNLLLLGGEMLYRRLKTPSRVVADDRQISGQAEEVETAVIDPLAPERAR